MAIGFFWWYGPRWINGVAPLPLVEVGDGTSKSVAEEAGARGDMFGSVTALFTGLAFAGLIITILLQRKELQLQREEMARSGDALEAQEKELRRTSEFMEQQVESQRMAAEIQALIQAKGILCSRIKGLRTRESEIMPKLEQAKTDTPEWNRFITNNISPVGANNVREGFEKIKTYESELDEVRAKIKNDELSIDLMNDRLVKIADGFSGNHLATLLSPPPDGFALPPPEGRLRSRSESNATREESSQTP